METFALHDQIVMLTLLLLEPIFAVTFSRIVCIEHMLRCEAMAQIPIVFNS